MTIAMNKSIFDWEEQELPAAAAPTISPVLEKILEATPQTPPQKTEEQLRDEILAWHQKYLKAPRGSEEEAIARQNYQHLSAQFSPQFGRSPFGCG